MLGNFLLILNSVILSAKNIKFTFSITYDYKKHYTYNQKNSALVVSTVIAFFPLEEFIRRA